MYASVADARMRLNGSYVLYKERIVLVEGAYEDEETDEIFLSIQSVVGRKEVPLEEVDLSPITLGYIQEGKTAVYLSRRPCRKWKQGLHPSENMVGRFVNLTVRPYHCVEVRGWLLRKYVSQKKLSLPHNVAGYPSLLKARELSKEDEGSSVAFSRDFAMLGNKIVYRGKSVVGYLRKGNPVLLTRYKYLNELLMESINERA